MLKQFFINNQGVRIMTLEELIKTLRKIGSQYLADYPKDSYYSTFTFHHNQSAAEALSTVGTKVGRSDPVETQESILLKDLNGIFSNIASTNALAKSVKDTLLKYEPFKEVIAKAKPNAQDMQRAFESLILRRTQDMTLQHAERKPG